MGKKFYNATEVAELMDVSKGQAYKIIKRLNEELESKGFITVTGKVPIKYLHERTYCLDIA